MNIRLLLFFLPFTIQSAIAQLPGYIPQPETTVLSDSQKISFSLNAKNFFKNNEYFNPIEEGYTLIGYNIEPSLVFQPTRTISIEAGGTFLKYSGRNGFYDIQPLFRFRYQPSVKFQMVMGNLYSGSNHKLYEPLYQWERDFTHPFESGLQFLINIPRLRADVWLNWEKFILQGDPFQEQLMVGISSNYRLNDQNSEWSFSIPLQCIFKHHGGQIISIDTTLTTLANWATGINISKKSPNSLLKQIDADVIYLGYADLSPTKLQQYKNGYGFLAQVRAAIKDFSLSTGYYHASKFISPIGERLYHSATFPKSDIYYNTLDLLIGKFSYQKRIAKGFSLGTYFESYTSLTTDKTDYSYGVHLLANFDILLARY
jgi:hypothetical protein